MQRLSAKLLQPRRLPCRSQSRPHQLRRIVAAAEGNGPGGTNEELKNNLRANPGSLRANSAEALRRSLGEVSSSQGRVAKTTNIILGTDNSMEKWRELDKKVNVYPSKRTFKAVGTGGQEFVVAMASAVASVVGTVHEECVTHRFSAKGNYISATIGPVWVEEREQVVAIYAAMRADKRLRWYM